MTNYVEEQQTEIEVLQSIYPTEYEEIQSTPPTFTIQIDSDEGYAEPCFIKLKVAFTDTYPDKLPEFKVLTDDAEELTREDRVKLNEVAQQTAEESLGMAMVFSMASVVKEMFDLILIEKAAAKQAADDARLAKEMELEQAKFVGTRVAPESFMAWKAKFDAEMAEIQRAQNSQKRNVEKNKKLTGRQMFEKDKSLARSDANFMEEGDTAVDASLFERVVSIRDDSDTSDRGSDAEE